MKKEILLATILATSMFGSSVSAAGPGSHELGTGNTASGTSSLASGYQNKTRANNSLVSGYNNTIRTFGENGITTGENNTVSGRSSSVTGLNNTVDGSNSNVAGSNNKATGHSTLVGGDSNNIKANNSIAFGHKNTVEKDAENSLVGGENSIANGRNSIAFGATAKANKDYTYAIGIEAETNAKDTIAIGNGAKVNGESSLVLGKMNQVDSNSSVAIGSKNDTIASDNSVVIGSSNKVQGTDKGQLIIGSNSKTKGENAMAIGNGAVAEIKNSVAIGADSVTGAAVAVHNSKEHNSTITFSNSNFAGSDPESVVSIGKSGYTRQLQNVAAGRISNTSTDAVNGSQLYDVALEAQKRNTVTAGSHIKVKETDNQYGRKNYEISLDQDTLDKINNIGNESRKGIAGVAALSALHPLDFDPDNKPDIMAGYGHFHNSNAAAIGLAYRPNEDLMFTIGSSIGGADTTVNAGVSYKIGAKSNVSRSKVAMAKDLANARKLIEEQGAQIAKLTATMNAILGTNMVVNDDKLFPDVPKNHWAYVAVEDLRERGLLIEFPDGKFKEDSMITRYEFAEIVYRALKRAREIGAEVNERLVDEFSPEMARYKVETVKKDNDGNPIIERVHTLESTPEYNRDAYGTIIK